MQLNWFVGNPPPALHFAKTRLTRQLYGISVCDKVKEIWQSRADASTGDTTEEAAK